MEFEFQIYLGSKKNDDAFLALNLDLQEDSDLVEKLWEF